MALKYRTTADIKVSNKVSEQIIGQEEGINIIRKSARQRRNVLLIGESGTGKSMLGQALAELLPNEKLVDVLAFPNPVDENVPLVKTMPKGQGKLFVNKAKVAAMGSLKNMNLLLLAFVLIASLLPYYLYSKKIFPFDNPTIYAASMITSMILIIGFMIFINLNKRMGGKQEIQVPKLLIDNSDTKKAPFIDATGAHAGALLGDVLHDPLQCFFTAERVITLGGSVKIKDVVDSSIAKASQNNLVSKDAYEAAFLPKSSLYVLGLKEGNVQPVEVLSCNRHTPNNELITLTTESGNTITITSGHKIAKQAGTDIEYVEASSLKQGDSVSFVDFNTILTDENIIQTYNKRQQDLSLSYSLYKQIRSKNPQYGYKKIASKLGVSYGRTRWWMEHESAPVPVQTAEWLKNKGLLPLNKSNPRAAKIAKVLGALFGDGGIFENLNGIFLSSAERDSVEEFGTDLAELFGEEIQKNSRIIEGGIEGHSWCYQNTNRNIIRFFLALGAPVGNKAKKELQIPWWIYLEPSFAEEFFGSFMGNEMGSPKVHKHGNRLDTLDVSMTARGNLIANRREFLGQLRRHLQTRGIISTSIHESKPDETGLIILRLLISIRFENVTNFLNLVKVNYSRKKFVKLVNSMNEFSRVKRRKYDGLLQKGYGGEQAMRLLKLTPASLYSILNYETFDYLLWGENNAAI